MANGTQLAERKTMTTVMMITFELDEEVSVAVGGGGKLNSHDV